MRLREAQGGSGRLSEAQGGSGRLREAQGGSGRLGEAVDAVVTAEEAAALGFEEFWVANVYECLRMSTNVYECLRMSTSMGLGKESATSFVYLQALHPP